MPLNFFSKKAAYALPRSLLEVAPDFGPVLIVILVLFIVLQLVWWRLDVHQLSHAEGEHVVEEENGDEAGEEGRCHD